MSDQWQTSVDVIAGQCHTVPIETSIGILSSIFHSVLEFLEPMENATSIHGPANTFGIGN